MIVKQKPDWLKIQLPKSEGYKKIKNIVRNHQLHTICESGRCPNISECWERGTATFMILGDICTRACKFCNVKTGKPLPINRDEPYHVAKSIQRMKLSHAVITSVDRDDLADGGAGLWAKTIMEVKKLNPQITLEVLIPDFNGKEKNIQKIIDAKPEVISHNLETVERLTPIIRSKAKYRVSLQVLKIISTANLVAKSGLMLGLGESENEVTEAFNDLRDVGVSVITLGQYLRPGLKNVGVVEYITPKKFEKYFDIAKQKGFEHVESGPFVRSSYRAERHFER